MKQYLRAREAAEYLGVAEQTLAKWRIQGGKVAFSRIGRMVVYDLADLDEYAAAQRRYSTSEAAPSSAQKVPRPAYASGADLEMLQRRVDALTHRVVALEDFLQKVRFSPLK